MKRILVTGAGGFIGSHLMKQLNKEYPNNFLFGLFRRSYSWPKGVKEGAAIFGNITDYSFMKEIIAENEITHVFHLAAQPIVFIAEKSPISTLQTNIIGTTILLELCKEFKFTLIYQSTDKVLGNITNGNLNSPYAPEDLYGISKTAAEQLCNFYRLKYGLDIRVVRPCNIFGFDKNINRLIPDVIISCLNNKYPTIHAASSFFDVERFMKRQFIYIDDFIQKLILLALKDEHPTSLYHIAADYLLTTKEVALFILEHFPDLELKYKQITKKAFEIQDQSLDISSCYRPLMKVTPFKEAIKQTIEEYRRWLNL